LEAISRFQLSIAFVKELVAASLVLILACTGKWAPRSLQGEGQQPSWVAALLVAPILLTQ
jgi:hypothetical protein